MNRVRLSFAVLLAGTAAISSAQGWRGECLDPENTAPYSDDYATNGTGNAFIRFGIGVSGTVTYGGESGPCYAPARTLDAVGRFALSIGNVGSVQTSFDNNMALTYGAPTDPVGDFCYARIYTGEGSFLYGEGGLASVFNGESLRYVESSWRNGTVEAKLVVRAIGDALKFDWSLRNVSQDNQQLGLRFGAYTGMATTGTQDVQGHDAALTLRTGLNKTPRPQLVPGGSPYLGYVETGTTRPPRTEKNFVRSNPRFPEQVNFQWSFAQPYGMRIDNGPTSATPDATVANHFLIGNHQIALLGNNMNPRVFTDTGAGDPAYDATADPVREDSDTGISEMAFIQSFPFAQTPPGQISKVVYYVRAPWSAADYVDPYAVVVDGPRVVEPTPGSGVNDLSPNPMRIVAYVDNQYSVVDRETTMTNVRFRINITPGSGLVLADGETAEKTVATIDPNQIRNVEWRVVADGTVTGYIPYSVTVTPRPGPTKTIESRILVSATPRVRLPEGANLLTFPWAFADTSLEDIFGPVGDPDALRLGRDFLAYRWDPNVNSYQPVTSVVRGEAVWIVPTSDFGYRQLNGARLTNDQDLGGLTTTLRPGWNMIGNPYSVPIPLSQITAVFDGDPGQALTWSDLVTNGLVSSGLAYWERNAEDPLSGFYRFTAGETDLIFPQVGYWVYVTTLQPIRLSWPPVFTPGLSTLTRNAKQSTWKQTDKQWRVQLVARNESGVDAENYVGITTSEQNANVLRRYEPPTSPNPTVELSVLGTVAGRETRLAQDLVAKSGKTTWKVQVRNHEAGEVTVNWPNVNTLPRNVRMTFVDPSTGTRRDMRYTSNYRFQASEPGTRSFNIEMEQGGTSRALIGNVVVSRPSRAPGAPVTINYALSSDANTTVRILTSAGREVFTISRGRAANSGENSAVWNLRDNANRAVAPGTYQVEILAESSTGERVRRVVPVNVVR